MITQTGDGSQVLVRKAGVEPARLAALEPKSRASTKFRHFRALGIETGQGKKKWGERWDSNPRPPEPQSRALPTELHPPHSGHGMVFLFEKPEKSSVNFRVGFRCVFLRNRHSALLGLVASSSGSARRELCGGAPGNRSFCRDLIFKGFMSCQTSLIAQVSPTMPASFGHQSHQHQADSMRQLVIGPRSPSFQSRWGQNGHQGVFAKCAQGHGKTCADAAQKNESCTDRHHGAFL